MKSSLNILYSVAVWLNDLLMGSYSVSVCIGKGFASYSITFSCSANLGKVPPEISEFILMLLWLENWVSTS